MRAVELLQQHYPRELVGQRHRPQRKAMVDAVEVGGHAEWPADHKAQVPAAAPTLLQPPAERDRVHLLPVLVQERHKRPVGQPPRDLLVLPDFDLLEPRVPGDQLLIVAHVVGVWRAQTPHGHDDHPHDVILRPMDDPNRPERHINIHFSPEIMAGVYANFANVSHSEYEFTVTFARVDHEVEDDEIPGVVVSRINLSPKFMRELIDAMQDNYSKWETREGIKNLPEYPGRQDFGESESPED